jgi:hypothetical protein
MYLGRSGSFSQLKKSISEADNKSLISPSFRIAAFYTIEKKGREMSMRSAPAKSSCLPELITTLNSSSTEDWRSFSIVGWVAKGTNLLRSNFSNDPWESTLSSFRTIFLTKFRAKVMILEDNCCSVMTAVIEAKSYDSPSQGKFTLP